ncbi:MFS transporter [Micromonospora sp. 067-2]|uniref:MFS transporter n=1 Tax=Micromonospora sp. 067-2 TaxID=2789270 RepID=UPI00397944E0
MAVDCRRDPAYEIPRSSASTRAVRDWFWTSLLGHGVWNGAAAVLTTLGPAVAIDRLGGETTWVLLLQAGAIGMLAGSLLAGRVRLHRPMLLANLGLACYAAPLFLLAVAAPAPAVIAAYAVALTALGYLNPVWGTVVQHHFPPEVLARVTSYDWLVSLGAVGRRRVRSTRPAGRCGPAGPGLLRGHRARPRRTPTHLAGNLGAEASGGQGGCDE